MVSFFVLSDILGDEDHIGDMDFKVAGTESGITGLQMDIKIGGVSREVLTQALDQAREGRLHILSKMQSSIGEPRNEMSPYAPRIHRMKINTDKIKDLIGPGGKMIRSIIAETGAKIDVEDTGEVLIASADGPSLEAAVKWVEQICEDAEVGKIYKGAIKRIVDFGAFVEILPGTEGLLHISQIANERIESVADHLSEGDEIEVKVIEIDGDRVRLSRKVLLDDYDESKDKSQGPPPSRGGSRSGGRRSSRR